MGKEEGVGIPERGGGDARRITDAEWCDFQIREFKARVREACTEGKMYRVSWEESSQGCDLYARLRFR